MNECLNCEGEMTSFGWNSRVCNKCGLRLFPESGNHHSLAYVKKVGKKKIWREVPEGLLAVFKEVEL